MQLVIAEKPSVGRDLARVLGARTQAGNRNSYEGGGYVVSWCVGHLVELDEPAAYDARWQAWRMDMLPMLPTGDFKLRASKQGADQLKVVAALLNDRRFESVINACDAGREGELIFRYVYQYASSRLPIMRLWVSSLTDDAIKRGFAALRPGAQYDALGEAARSRSEADWLVGLNATRAVTLRARQRGGDTLLSIGRVQTPTLAMLVARAKAIAAFKPRDYWEVEGRFATVEKHEFSARWLVGRASQLATAALADGIVVRCSKVGSARDPNGPRVDNVKSKTVREPAPQLFDLTSLQRTANKRYGFSAQRTLDIAQALYERHKVLSYPRTDSRYLSTDVAKELPKHFLALANVGDYEAFAKTLLATSPKPSKRVVDDSKVSDHHAIIPTASLARLDALDRDEHRVFDLVARRFLGVFFPDAEFAVTTALVRVGGVGKRPEIAASAPPASATETDDDLDKKLWAQPELPPPPDWFVARGRVRLNAGWQVVAGIGGDDADGDKDAVAILPPLVEGQALDGVFAPQRKQTLPPRPYTEATLLGAMESAGKALTDDELRAAMKDTGLGTPATRASIIETLIKRNYIERDKKQINATSAGRALIDALPVQSLASPELTGEWEARLARIARREDTRGAFMADIVKYVRDAIEAIKTAPIQIAAGQSSRPRPSPSPRPNPSPNPNPRPRPSPSPSPSPNLPPLTELTCPRCKLGTILVGKRGWGCTRWREDCKFVVWFETSGKRLTDDDLRDLIQTGRTRTQPFALDGKTSIAAHLTLDANAEGGTRFVVSPTGPDKDKAKDKVKPKPKPKPKPPARKKPKAK